MDSSGLDDGRVGDVLRMFEFAKKFSMLCVLCAFVRKNFSHKGTKDTKDIFSVVFGGYNAAVG